MALTKKEFQLIAEVLGNLKTAQKYISKPEIKLINTTYKTGYKEDIFTNGTGVQTGLNMNKEIGSDIVYLKHSIKKLELFLYPTKNEEQF